MPPFLPLDAALLGCVAAAAATDLARRKIPNRLVLCGLCGALALHLLPGAASSALTWLGGALTGLLLFLPLYMLRGMAAGDVKLMAMVGAFCGPAPALRIGLATVLIGALMALSIVAWRGRGRATLARLRFLLSPRAAAAAAPAASVGGMPYGVAIALGTLLQVAGRHL
jgi:prepilin peptidase CpaA